MEAKIIGIGGVSRSGKSILARKLEKAIHGTVLVLSQDDFTRPISEIPLIQDRTDWEQPDSIDFERLIAHIRDQKNSFEFIIVEGLLAFANEELNTLYGMTILLTISKETFLARRKKETRWGKEPDWYLEHVWESYLRSGEFRAEILLTDWNGEIQNVIGKIS